MMVVPKATPVTTPVPDPIVATVVALLLQVPPVTASVSVVFAPTQRAEAPMMADGVVYTCTIVVMRQPVGNV